MATTASQFFGTSTDNDFTDPSPGDYRKLEESAPAGNDNTTRADFGTSGNKNIILDPFTTNTTNSITDLSNYGWVVNQDGADGMVATTGSIHRLIYSGNWTIQGFLTSAPVAALNAVTLNARIYTKNSDGT